jgi:mRNA interferase RelE/StbE
VANYQVFLSAKAEKELDKLPSQIANQLIDAIESLGENPRPTGYIKLKGRSAYRVRSGNYRIIYEIQDRILLVEVIAIGHRKDIYK